MKYHHKEIIEYCTECKTSDCRQNFADWAYSDAPEKDQGV